MGTDNKNKPGTTTRKTTTKKTTPRKTTARKPTVRKKAKKPRKKPSKKKLIELAMTYAGVVTDMADAYDCSRQSMAKWCKEDEEIKEAMIEGRDVLVDLAKSGLKHHLEIKSEKSIHYTLDRLGRNQGFGQHMTLKNKDRFDESLDELTDEELMAMEERNNRRLKNG